MISKDEIRSMIDNKRSPCRLGDKVICFDIFYERIAADKRGQKYWDIKIGTNHVFLNSKAEAVKWIYKELNESK